MVVPTLEATNRPSAVVESGGGDAPIDISGEEAEAANLFAGPFSEPDVVVVDHYLRGPAFEAECRRRGALVLAIDDLGRPHDADIVLDPAPGSGDDDYVNTAPNALRLLGPAYAPLKPAIVEAGRAPESLRNGLPHLLISLGGADPNGVGVAALEALAPLSERVRLSVVVGAGARYADSVRGAAAAHGVRMLQAVDDMAGLLQTVDLAVGAGGVSALERCYLGVPSVLLEIAENQRRTIAGIVAAGAGWTIPVSRLALDLPEKVERLLTDNAAYARMVQAGRRLCDGRGAARVAELAVSPRFDRDGARLHLRPAAKIDRAHLFELQTEPAARRFARNPQPPSWDEHCAWFEAVLADPDRLLLVVRRENRTVGSLRFDRCASGGLEVSILIASESAGRGIGRVALALGEVEASHAFPDLAEQPIWAYVKAENQVSLRVFEAAGYHPSPKRPGWLLRSPSWKGRGL